MWLSYRDFSFLAILFSVLAILGSVLEAIVPRSNLDLDLGPSIRLNPAGLATPSWASDVS